MRVPHRFASTATSCVQPAVWSRALGAGLMAAMLCTGLPALAQTASGASTAVSRSQPVVVSQAWVRPAAKGQRVTGGYLQIQAQEAVTLLGFASPVAGKAEVHEMKMDGDVMRMRALPSLAIAAGQTVNLQPGGNHLMLFDLKQPIAAGAKVPLILKFQDARGKTFEWPVTAEARATSPSGARPDAAAHGHHGDHHDHH